MIWEAFGALTMVTGGLVFSHWQWGRVRYRDGRESIRLEMTERRAERRAEARARAAVRGHVLAPFPDEAEFEWLASTGELEAMAAAGQVDDLKRHVAAFWRVHQLREWIRKREAA